jgi:hypothetical protein
MVLVPKFTPEVLISAPRRGPAVPNQDGTLALFTQSTHTIGGETLKEIRILNIATGESEQLLSDEKASSVLWLGDGTNTVVYLSSGGAGFTWVMMADAANPSGDPYIVDFVQAPIKSLKVKLLKDGSVAFVVVGLVAENGELYNEESKKTTHTARVTESYHPRIVRSLIPFVCMRISTHLDSNMLLRSGIPTQRRKGMAFGTRLSLKRTANGSSISL